MSKFPQLETIIYDLHWMARRYADGRSSYAPGLLNRHVNELLEMGFNFKKPLYARDGMGRNFDGLTDADVIAAEEDMPTGHLQVVAETDERMKALRAAVIEECAKALEGLDCNANDPGEFLRSLKATPTQTQLEEPGTGDTVEPAHQSASLTQKSGLGDSE
jgi:hypothetical protein